MIEGSNFKLLWSEVIYSKLYLIQYNYHLEHFKRNQISVSLSIDMHALSNGRWLILSPMKKYLVFLEIF